MKEFKGRVIVPGRAKGRAVVVDSVSFYGDVDPKKGILKGSGRMLSGKILVARRSHGSTVGSYVIYSMKSLGTAPLAILMKRTEPIIVVGCVLADIPLIDALPDAFFEIVRDNTLIEVDESGKVVLYD